MYKIGILFQNRDFEHDVYELIKAFYPGNEITSLYEEDDADYDIRFRVSRDEEGYTISYDNGIEKKTAHGAVMEGQSSGEASDALISCDDAHDTRRKNKDAIKYALYQMLSKATGKTLPWGNLTGIRPVKMAMGMLESGMKNTEIARYMREQYLVSPEKTALAVTIANRERDILKNIDYENGYSLYVGIPFCPSICLYCSFSSYPLKQWKNRVNQYLEALCKEIKEVAAIMKAKGRKLDTVYIGGGTPTTLEPEQLKVLLDALMENFCCENLAEFTIEAGRPDSITREKLMMIRNYPITRISVNPQTMNQETLDIIGRRHTVEETKQAFMLARECGFDNINMDLIVGLPGMGKTTLLRDSLRRLSEAGRRVCVVDERSEIAAMCDGLPQLEVGPCTDVLDGCGKEAGLRWLLRSLSPEVLVTDELSDTLDAQAALEAIRSGVSMLATVHGRDLDSVCGRNTLYPLIRDRAFERYAVLDVHEVGKMAGIYDRDFQPVVSEEDA